MSFSFRVEDRGQLVNKRYQSKEPCRPAGHKDDHEDLVHDLLLTSHRLVLSFMFLFLLMKRKQADNWEVSTRRGSHKPKAAPSRPMNLLEVKPKAGKHLTSNRDSSDSPLLIVFWACP